MESIVLYPAPGMGHLISMVELGKLILTHHPAFTITILLTTPPLSTNSTAPYINHVSSTTPSITFHHLPTISLLPNSYPTLLALILDLLQLNNPNVHNVLQSISHTCTIFALIIDYFCSPALAVAANLNIPTYYFFTSGAGCLACYLYFPTIHQNTTKSFKDLNALLDIPGIPPIPSCDMANPMLERTTKVYESFLYFSTEMGKSAGIIVNTFDSLEERAVEAILDGLCVPDVHSPPTEDNIKPMSVGGFVTHRGWNSVLEADGAGVPMVEWPLYAEQKMNRVFLG
ncbi:hypothetical protein L1049_021263 [Liquidambar formosana]|uniref:Uncharacterized protein n=1 Tax=Liquidambar formosana TaxID=63359 RepID=A0AAP0S9C5_LIQFO